MPFREWRFNLKESINLLYLIAASLLQYLLVASFTSMGLADTAPLKISFGGTSIYISILFHLIPLNVILIILLSSTYLSKCKFKPSKKHTITTTGKGGIGLRFTHSILKEGLGVILLFGFSAFTLLALICPSAPYNFVVNLYFTNEFFRGFIQWSSWLHSSLIGFVDLFAVSFRSGLWNLVRPIGEPILSLNIEWKYLLCQNVAAWITAILTLAYGRYCESRRRR